MKATPTRKQLGRRIRKLRKKLKISQEELGFRSGLHRTYIGSIERTEQNVSVDNIHKIARALKVSASELFKKS
ncbi:transcriptional regulator [Candidatus Roizmanbacteria bacterium RIFCSPHIGHO2_01_FULL_37_16]|nr:MAG: transcriptional regulator [Candidatus Roizmanbacteria bacterium RIFCSPHIGHO2_01_FULL_37_16]